MTFTTADVVLAYVPSILDLLHRTLTDEDRTEALVKLGVGLIGDLADGYRNGEIRDALLQEWIVNSFKFKGRGYSPDTKKTLKWAKEVSLGLVAVHCDIDTDTSRTERQGCYQRARLGSLSCGPIDPKALDHDSFTSFPSFSACIHILSCSSCPSTASLPSSFPQLSHLSIYCT